MIRTLNGRAARFAAAAGMLLLAASCADQVPYTANTGLADSLGTEEAKRRLSQVLQRAQTPRVTNVRATDDYVQYFWETLAPETAIIDPLYVANVAEIHYGTVTKVEVYDNNWVFVWGPLREHVDKVLFGTADDARTFADLVSSFRARKDAKAPPETDIRPASTPKGASARPKPAIDRADG